MEAIVDAVALQSGRRGGISRMYREILPRMCDIEPSLSVTLLAEGKSWRSAPEHEHIACQHIPSVKRYLRPGRLWRPVVPRATRLVRRLWIGRGQGKIWHSTYYTWPDPWDGWQVVTVPDMIHERYGHLFGAESDSFKSRKRLCVGRADVVVCISETTRQDLQRFYGLNTDKVVVIPLASSAIFQRQDDLTQRDTWEPFLLYVGSRVHYKNFGVLLQAYRLWKHRDEVALLAVGKPWSADERQLLFELGIQDRVRLLTDVDDGELCRLYNRAEVFIYPSLYEGFGIPLLEAVSCGCPVVASQTPSTVEVAGECPVYFEPANAESLLDAIDVALSLERDSDRVQLGLELVQRYSWDRTAEQTLDVYRTLTNHRGSTTR